MKTVKLIVYGTLMSGERNHKFCKNALSIEPCTVTGTLYDTGCGFPAFQPEGENTIHAELIEIPLRDWFAIDRLEGYPKLYDRQLFTCTLSDGTTDTGWIYIMNNLPPMATVIKGGDWKIHRKESK
jgi:gamma-glutamylcyclotransferase (GGCT)/AIG2-like uncharacterized protein YtfP